MATTSILAAFILVFAGALTISIIQYYFTKNRNLKTIEEFLLAGRTLGKSSILNLFLSTSFGVTSFFYAVWLGYNLGFWAFLMQAAWSIGFLLLIPFVKKIKFAVSLHGFLGTQFNSNARLWSAVCYLASILFLMAWEVRIAYQPITKLITPTGEYNSSAVSQTVFILAIIIGVVLFYTLVGGLRGNATVDKFLNLLKIFSILLLTYFLLENFKSFSTESFFNILFPAYSSIESKLGLWGLVTNILLNLFSQFTDGSSWQSIIASGKEQNSSRNLQTSSILIFLTVGFFGSLIGVLLAGVPGISPDNILTAPFQLLNNWKSTIRFVSLVLVVACVMSLLNSLLLVSTRILAVDILQIGDRSWYDKYITSDIRKLWFIKTLVVIIAFLSIGGINYIIELSGLSLFDLIYIFMVCPFCYFGPVIAGLRGRKSKKMGTVIAASLLSGFSCILVGTVFQLKFLLEGAATFTLLLSALLAYLVSAENRFNNQ